MVRNECPIFKQGFFTLIIISIYISSFITFTLNRPNAMAQATSDDYLEIWNGFENDNYRNAIAVNPGEYPELTCQDDDWYKVNVPDLGEIIMANLKVTILFLHKYGDLDLTLYSAKAPPNDYNFLDISGLAANEEVVSASVPPGDYLIRVYGYKGVKNNYAINMEILYPCQYVTYEWIDITNGGEALPLKDDDYKEIPIGFDFKFYDHIYDRVKVSSNGYLTFAEKTHPYFNPNSPTPIRATHKDAPPISIFSYWMNLRPDLGGGIFYKTDDQSNPKCKKLIVEWRDIPKDSDDGAITFQAVLFERTNQILLQYKDMIFSSQNDGYSLGSGATVGITNGRKTTNSLIRIATQSLYKNQSLTEKAALMFTPSLHEPLRILSSNLIGAHLQSLNSNQQIKILFSQYLNGNNLKESISIDPMVIGEWMVSQNRIAFDHPGNPFNNKLSYEITLLAEQISDCFGNVLLGDAHYTFIVNDDFPDIDQPAIEVSPTSLSFGNVFVNETSNPLEIVIFNRGNTDLEISGLTLQDQDIVNFSFDVTKGPNPLGNLPAIISKGKNRKIAVTFTASTEKTFNNIIEITSNDLDTARILVSMQGTGISPPKGWTNFDQDNCFGSGNCLTGSIITALMLDANETLWIGTEEGGICAYSLYTGALSCFDQDDGLAGNNVIDIAIGPQGELWVATDIDIYGNKPGVSRFNSSSGIFESYNTVQMGTYDDLWIYDIVVDNNNHLWIGTDFGLLEFDGVYWNKDNSVGSYIIMSLNVDSSGRLWIGTVFNGLFVKESFEPPRRVNFNFGIDISEITIDPSGNLWIVSIRDNKNSLIFSNPDSLILLNLDGFLPETIPIPDSLVNPESFINDLFIHPVTGNLFIASNNGSYMYDGETWHHFNPTNAHLASPYINSIIVDPYNDYWIGTEEGLSHFNSAAPYIVGGVYGIENRTDNLPIDTSIFVNFSEPMNRNSTEDLFEMINIDNNGSIVLGTFNWNKNSTVIKFEPYSSLAYNSNYEIRIYKEATDRACMTIDPNVCEGADYCSYFISTKDKPESEKKQPSTSKYIQNTGFFSSYWPNYNYWLNYSLPYWSGYSKGKNLLGIPVSNINLQYKVNPYSNYQFMRVPQVQTYLYTRFNTRNLFSSFYYNNYTNNISQTYWSSLQGSVNYSDIYKNR